MNDISISLVIPCWNAGGYLDDALDSVLSQTGDFDLREILVVDDRSTDHESLAALDRARGRSKVIVMPNDRPQGVGHARNAAVERARGEWIVFLDADDVLTQDSIEARCVAARLFPDCGFISGDFRVWEDGQVSPDGFFASSPKPRAVLDQAFATRRPILLRRPAREFIDAFLSLPSVMMVRRQLYQSIGGMDGTLRRAQDYHFAIRAAAASDFAFVPETVALYRQHASQITRTKASPRGETIEAFTRLSRDPALAEHRERLAARIASFHVENAMHFRKHADFGNAIGACVRAIRSAPSNRDAWRGLAAAILRR